MNWYIGQKVVALETVDDDNGNTAIVKGRVYTILSMQDSTCKCKEIEIWTGATCGGEEHCVECEECGVVYESKDDKWWVTENHYAPLESKPELSEHTDETILIDIEQEEQLMELIKLLS